MAVHTPAIGLNPWVTSLAAPAVPAVAAWAQAYDGAQGPLLGFSQAVPGYPPHARILQRLADLAADPQTCQYGDIEGEPALRSALADWMARIYGIHPGAAQIQITSGCNQAFAVAMQVMARAGDAVALVEPYYFNHQSTLQSMGIEIKTVQAHAENGFLPTVADVAQVLEQGVKALVLISPNNPTGAVYSPELLEQLADLCQRHGCWLVLDETYRDFLPAGTVPHRLLERPNWQQHIVLLYSFSKSFCVPGHRLGALIAGETFQAETCKVMDNLQICAPRLPQLAIAQALGDPVIHDWLSANRDEIARRAQAMREAFASLQQAGQTGWQISAIGAYFAFVRHPLAHADSVQVARKLAQECGLLTIPGEFFGPGQGAYLRVAFANAGVDVIEKIPERIGLLAVPSQVSK
ncbi:MAG: aminotransferase [Brachymonas sp.]|nr:aminotransferase [Brachymonas sp.]